MKEWELETRIETIINNNIKEIPWEGDYVDKEELKQDIKNLIKELNKQLMNE